jgi:hypothetical protein
MLSPLRILSNCGDAIPPLALLEMLFSLETVTGNQDLPRIQRRTPYFL